MMDVEERLFQMEQRIEPTIVRLSFWVGTQSLTLFASVYAEQIVPCSTSTA